MGARFYNKYGNNSSSDASLVVLNSTDDFKKWYLELYDMSMFSDTDIAALLNDEKPQEYPCIPLVFDKSEDIIYISTELAKCLSGQLKTEI
ncbi:hypothetical protein [Enterobacter chuandaensis]|uniref:Uncharacterized protein n=1 Tax=Enterobacter chuandaensis TaxID=2497875 RepID=A0AA96M4T4_9ENTR|nr:hypothetical protein [Enterobacter chuandaensis]MCW4783059.1 hypothetical protein [Enterobacter chuandaensis]MDA4760262.1 hypothetical protein [Enterobacter chuandaensis]WNS37168.1 hypothetical protein RQP59_19175 [Enterobacter chuandaensis]